MAYGRIMPIFRDIEQDPRAGIPELPNWGIGNNGGFGGGSSGSNLRRFRPSAGSDLGAFQPGQNSADSMLRDIFRQSTEGTTRSFDTAANRLRERIDSAGQSKKATARQGMRGLGASGFANRRDEEIDSDSLFSYGQGLTGLESEFENARQQGLQTALGAGRSIQEFDQSTNQLGQQDFGQRRSAMNDASIANSQIGFNRANAMDNLAGEDRRASRANSLQMMLEQMRDRRERDISRDTNETQLKIGRRGDLSRILQLLEGL